jgi:hypothetical protein
VVIIIIVSSIIGINISMSIFTVVLDVTIVIAFNVYVDFLLLLLLLLNLQESIQIPWNRLFLGKADSHPASPEVPSTLCSPAPATGPCPEPNLFSPQSYTLLLNHCQLTAFLRCHQCIQTEIFSTLCSACASISYCHKEMATLCFPVVSRNKLCMLLTTTHKKNILKNTILWQKDLLSFEFRYKGRPSGGLTPPFYPPPM